VRPSNCFFLDRLTANFTERSRSLRETKKSAGELLISSGSKRTAATPSRFAMNALYLFFV
jgi:hypothetical protein